MAGDTLVLPTLVSVAAKVVDNRSMDVDAGQVNRAEGACFAVASSAHASTRKLSAWAWSKVYSLLNSAMPPGRSSWVLSSVAAPQALGAI